MLPSNFIQDIQLSSLQVLCPFVLRWWFCVHSGSYEDSLKSLHQSHQHQHGMARHHSSAGEGARRPQRRRQREPNNTPPPPPHHSPGTEVTHLGRRNSERVVICPLDHHRAQRANFKCQVQYQVQSTCGRNIRLTLIQKCYCCCLIQEISNS